MVEDLDRAVRTVVERCLAVAAGDNVLVVADPGNAELGDALMHAARAAGGDAVLTILPPNPSRGTEPPPTVAAALAAADVFIAPCLPSLSHTTARKRASEGGARGATMPGVTADLLARLMSADFDAMSARCHAVADLLSAGDEAHVTCPRGTDMRLDLRGRDAIADDGDLRPTVTPQRPSSPTSTGTGRSGATSPSSASARTTARRSPATRSRTRRSSARCTSPSAPAPGSVGTSRSRCTRTSWCSTRPCGSATRR